MSYPSLHTSTTTDFTNNGLGILSDTISCKITEERNGVYELQMEYPITGIHFSDIALRSLILAKPNPYDETQPFRVYRMTRPLNGRVTIYAEHISYDLSGIVVSPFSATGIQGAFDELKKKSATEHPFTFWTDKTTAANMTVSSPTTLRSLLGGVQGSILDVYGGGDYMFDRFDVKLYQNRGLDNGVSIRYGKNLTDIQQEENCSSVYTGVFPYWQNNEGELLVLSEKIVNAEGTYNFTKIMPLDLSSEWQEKPTEAQLRERAQSYVKANNIGVPSVSLTVSFIQLEQTEEYKSLALLERVALCDTVSVIFPDMGVSAKAKVIKTVYDVLLDRYESIEVGDSKGSLADTIMDQAQETEKKLEDTRNHLQQAVEDATQAITGNKGGYVVLHDSDGDKQPDELLIMDSPTIEDAMKIWRWNEGGLGYSSRGYNGPYGTAITAQGQIVANFVNAGELDATVIKAGVIKNLDEVNETFYLDIASGELRMKASKLSIEAASGFGIGDQTLESYTQDKANNAAAQELESFVNDTYDPQIANLQSQIDGQIESYYFDYVPTLDNEPAVSWTTEDDKKGHEGDLFYNKSTGFAYRFFKDADTWKWQLIKDTDITSALDKASKAQDTADGKRRVFVDIPPKTPTPPYDVGDLWAQGKDGDLKRCKTAKKSGATFADEDWELASKYTDDKALNDWIEGEYKENFEALKSQNDKKAQTWYGNIDPTTDPSWDATADHEGDLWYKPGEEKSYIYRDSAWVETKSSPPRSVFDSIDGKAQIFAAKPTTPYYKNDLWFNGRDSAIQICTFPRALGDKFYEGDWTKYDKYIDQLDAEVAAREKVDEFDSSLTQEEVFNRLTNNKENQGIYIQGGNLYINASMIHAGTLSANYIRGGELALGGVSNTNGVMKLYDNTGARFGTFDSSGIVLSNRLNPELSSYSISIMDFSDSTTLETTVTIGSFYITINGTGAQSFLYANRLLMSKGGALIDLNPEGTRLDCNVTVTGKKSRAIDTPDYDTRLEYCYEMPSPMFGDIGQGVTDDSGMCYIYLDDVFSETVATQIEYQVFLQKEGSGDLWVEQKAQGYFTVKGTPNLKFAWEVKAKQRDYEYERLERFEMQEDEDKVDYVAQYDGERLRLIKEREDYNNETAQ